VKEIGLVLLTLLALAALAAAGSLAGLTLVEDGQFVMLTAAAVGIPLQMIYFAALGSALTWSKVRPPGWYWRPFAHHHLLSPTQRWLVLPVFYAAALAFLVILLGIATTVLGLADMLLEG
jgi:hypothetical protein